MIKYNSGSFGFQLLLRLHGSAVFKSLTPALLSSAIFLILLFTTDLEDDDILDHPYPIGVLIAALTFLLAFRANFSYNRYWEAMTAVHQMHSKWLDVGMELAAFHLQSSAYDQRKPPAFGQHPEIKSVERERERLNQLTLEELEEQLEQLDAQDELGIHGTPMEPSLRTRMNTVFKRKSNTRTTEEANELHSVDESEDAVESEDVVDSTRTDDTKKTSNVRGDTKNPEHRVVRFLKLIYRDQPKEEVATQLRVSTSKTKTRVWEDGKPPLFLQEGAHLLSLLSAIAMSTLRNDLEQADSPLATFVPGAPWPHVDPDAYNADVRKDWASSRHQSWTVLRYLLGTSRNPKSRTLYNAARPFRVVGGVSDAEIELLQAARGPLAKVAICSMWLQEFSTREHLNGSTGKVAPPIISRLYQFTSDGMLGYNQARKIAYIPFPFPHAQITSLFVLVVCGFMPVLMLSFLMNEPFGFVLNLFTVMCFTGLHEVARELENPFQNVPNDIPLNNFQAQFNESLMNMFTGYHPDAYWEVKEEEVPAIDEMMTNNDEPKEVEDVDESNDKKNVEGSNNKED